MPEPPPALPLRSKVALAARIWLTFLSVRARFRRPLPELVADLAGPPAASASAYEDPRRLSSALHRVLRIGRRRPTCLLSSLVLFRLLRRQGETAQLVIGLPAQPRNKNAHAWVEVDGAVVGPPPGRLDHEPLARYP
jgi:hypothetical protein